MISDDLIKQFPLPWTTRKVEQGPTQRCHHKTETWAFFDADGKRVFMSEHNCTELLKTINDTTTTHPVTQREDLKEEDFDWL